MTNAEGNVQRATMSIVLARRTGLLASFPVSLSFWKKYKKITVIIIVQSVISITLKRFRPRCR